MINVTLRENVRIFLSNYGRELPQSITRAMLEIVARLQAYIRTQKLRGGNPLYQRTGRLSRAVNTNVTTSGNTVTGTVGVGPEAPYGAVHEHGGTFTVREHMSRSIKGRSFSVREHMATFPTRSFLRSSLAENNTMIQNLLQAANQDATQRSA